MTVTVALIIVNCIVSYLSFNNPEYFNKLAHVPFIELRMKEYSRFITSGFVHGSYPHLFINMLVFWQFGTEVEHMYAVLLGSFLGKLVFILMYLGAIIVSNIPSYFKNKDNRNYVAVGASGAVSATLFSFVLFSPWSTLLVMMVIPMPALFTAILYLGYEQWASRNMNDNIGHDAHITGAIWGFLFTLLLDPALINNLFQRN